MTSQMARFPSPHGWMYFLINICCCFSIHLSNGGHSGRCHVFAIVNNIAMNMGCTIYPSRDWFCVLGYILRSGIVEPMVVLFLAAGLWIHFGSRANMTCWLTDWMRLVVWPGKGWWGRGGTQRDFRFCLEWLSATDRDEEKWGMYIVGIIGV